LSATTKASFMQCTSAISSVLSSMVKILTPRLQELLPMPIYQIQDHGYLTH
jgi:hypothetical protein